MYYIKTVADRSQVEEGNQVTIHTLNWEGNYAPVSYAKVCFVPGEGFVAKLWCEEADPMVRYENRNDPVWQDSCLEWFCNFKPQYPAVGYLNFEVNANGAILSERGTGKFDRHFLSDLGIDYPEVTPFRTDSLWGYTLFVPLCVIEQAYGEASFKKGDLLRGSFFKCGFGGDRTHYICYNKVGGNIPHFHQPFFFDDMMID